MKIMETASFRFKFKDIESKEKSYELLKKFLVKNDWTDEFGNNKLPLSTFHTYQSGVCEIILAKEKRTEDFMDHIEELFNSLKTQENISWVKTVFNNNTEDIVYNNIDKYQKYQEKNISEIVKGDIVLVYKK